MVTLYTFIHLFTHLHIHGTVHAYRGDASSYAFSIFLQVVLNWKYIVYLCNSNIFPKHYLFIIVNQIHFELEKNIEKITKCQIFKKKLGHFQKTTRKILKVQDHI